jgi:hypothetical protein
MILCYSRARERGSRENRVRVGAENFTKEKNSA